MIREGSVILSVAKDPVRLPIKLMGFFVALLLIMTEQRGAEL